MSYVLKKIFNFEVKMLKDLTNWSSNRDIKCQNVSLNITLLSFHFCPMMPYGLLALDYMQAIT